MVWEAVRRTAWCRRALSEGCTAGAGSCSPDVWYVMKPMDWPDQGYRPGENDEPLSSVIYVLKSHPSVIWDMNLGAVWEGSGQRSPNQGHSSGHEM